MIITCEECKSKFNLDESRIKPAGSKVRCSSCQYIFVVYPPKPEEVMDLPEAVVEEEKPTPPEPASTDMDLDFSLDDDDSASGFDAGDDIDFKLDFDEIDGSDEFGGANIDDGLGIDLDDADLDLSSEMEDDDFEDLDLGELDLDLNALDSDAPGDDAEDLSLSFDDEPATETSAEDELGDLDLNLDDTGGAEDTDLSFDIDEAPVSEGEDDLGEIDLDLDDTDEDADVSFDIEDDEEEDLTELDLDFIDDEAPGEEVDLASDLEDLGNLDLDLTVEDEDEDAGNDEAEIDLSLDGDDTDLVTEASADVGDVSFELDLDLESSELSDTPGEQGDDLKLELDIEAHTEEDGDLELTLDIEDMDGEEGDDIAETMMIDDVDAQDAVSEEAPDASEATAEPVKKPFALPKKKKSKAPLWILLVMILLGGAGFGAYFFADQLNIKNIPYINEWLGAAPDAKDPGNLKIETVNITNRFVEHPTLGNLFVIQGKVVNNYDTPRSFVSLTGKLFTMENKAKKLVKQKTVFAGNMIEDSALKTMDMAGIEKAMRNRFGNNKSNSNISPGKAVPFMMVFSKLPDNLTEYTVEVAKSF